MKYRYLILSLIISLFAVAANAQDDVIRVETDLVTVNVVVRDANGKFVKGLRREQFEIFDNKKKQQISHFSAQDAPVSFGIVYDMHPTTEDRTNAVLDSLRSFTKQLGDEDRFFIVAFNERGNLKLDFIPTAEQIRKNLKRSEPTSLYDAIYLAANKLRDSKNLKRTILIISDSADHHSHHSFSQLSNQLKSFDVQVYAVIFDEREMSSYSDITRGERRKRISGDASGLDRSALQNLTVKSGGTSHFPTTENSQRLYEIYGQIASEMREFYTLSFYPTETDGGRHEIRIGLRSVKGSKGFALTYRQGYQGSLQKR